MLPRYLARTVRRAIPGDLVESVTLMVRVRSNDAVATYQSYVVPRVILHPLSGGEQAIDGVMASTLPKRDIEVYLADLQDAVPVAPATGTPGAPQSGDIWLRASGEKWLVDGVTADSLGEVLTCNQCVLRPAGTP